MAEVSGRPLSISVAQAPRSPLHYRRILDAISEANADGLEVRAQVATRRIGILLGLQASVNPLARSATVQRARRPAAARARRPAVRSRREGRDPRRVPRAPDAHAAARPACSSSAIRPTTSPIRRRASQRARRAARRRRRRARSTTCCSATGARRCCTCRSSTTPTATSTPSARCSPIRTRCPGLSDGGAHVGTICDASFPTTLLTHWGRDRTRGERFEVPWLVKRQTADTAAAVGLLDRGVLAPGYRADINVIDFDRLGLGAPHLVFDLPAGGKRLLQRATATGTRSSPAPRCSPMERDRRASRPADPRRAISSDQWGCAMKSLIISADSHITEPPDTYIDYIDPAYRDRAPQMIDRREARRRVRHRRHVEADLARSTAAARASAGGDQVVRRRSSRTSTAAAGTRTPAWPIRTATAWPPRSSTRPSAWCCATTPTSTTSRPASTPTTAGSPSTARRTPTACSVWARPRCARPRRASPTSRRSRRSGCAGVMMPGRARRRGLRLDRSTTSSGRRRSTSGCRCRSTSSRRGPRRRAARR